MQTFEDALEPHGFADFNRAGDLSNGQHGGYLGDRGVAAEAVAWLQEKGSAVDQPWFLAVNFQNPHDVMFARTHDEQAPEMFEIVYPPDTPPFDQDWSPSIPDSFDDDLSDKPQAHRDYLAAYNFAFGKQPGSADPDGVARLKRHLNYYINAAITVDEHIRTVLEGLKSTELLANTIIIFTSDHGEMGGAHGLTQKGGLPYRENLQVPLIIVHPDIKGGQTVNGVASALDLAPTILSFAQTPPAQYPALKGVDLTPALTQPANGTPRSNRIGGLLATYDSLFSADLEFARAIIERGPRQTGGPTLVEHIRILPPPKPWRGLNRNLIIDLSGRTVMRMVFDGRYKFVRYFAINDYHVPFDWHTLIERNDIELYDLAEDPNEMVNLAYGERREMVRPLIMQMNRKLNALISHEIGEDKAVVPSWFIRMMTFLKRCFPSKRPTVQEQYGLNS